MENTYPSLRVLFKAEHIPQRRIQRVAATATGYNFSMSTVTKWCSGDRKWPDALRNPLYRFLQTMVPGIKRGEFNALYSMTREEIRSAENDHDHR